MWHLRFWHLVMWPRSLPVLCKPDSVVIQQHKEVHATAGRIYFKTSLSSHFEYQSTLPPLWIVQGGKRGFNGLVSLSSNHTLWPRERQHVRCSLFWWCPPNLGGCSSYIKWVLKGFNTTLLLPVSFCTGDNYIAHIVLYTAYDIQKVEHRRKTAAIHTG